MSIKTYNRTLYIAAAAAVLAWPFGELLRLVLAAGQDGPGDALAQTFGTVVTVIVWGGSTAIIIWRLRAGARSLSRVAQATIGIAVIILPVAFIVSAANQQVYDLEARNETGMKIYDVSVRMTGRRYSFGILGSKKSATIAFQQDRATSPAELSWTGDDGRSHRVEIDLSEVIPRRYDGGILTFTIAAADDVKVGFFIYPDISF